MHQKDDFDKLRRLVNEYEDARTPEAQAELELHKKHCLEHHPCQSVYRVISSVYHDRMTEAV